MKTARYIIIAVLGVISVSQSTAQSKQAFINAAEEAFEEKNFYAALKYYNEVLEFKNPSPYVYYKAAEAARHFFAFETALEYYKEADALKDKDELPLSSFYTGEMAYQMGAYEEATKFYNKYLRENSNADNFYTQTAKNQLESIEWAQQNEEPPFISQIEKLGDSINTIQSEFAPIKLGENLIFSALRYPDENPEEKPVGVVFNDRLDTVFHFIADEDSMRYQAHYAINMDSTRVYYTLCQYTTGELSRCDIYYSGSVEGSWSAPMYMPELNDTAYSNTSPAYGIGPDGETEGLYFASDRIGGRGGYDIYFSAWDGSGFEAPENLYQINTPLNELAPFYHQSSNTLFFSSEGYSGYGGLDMYQVFLPVTSDSKVENLGSPLNSSFDDIYFFWEENMKDAYFASNRNTSYQLDTALNACCYDIYKADLEPRKLVVKVLVFNKLNGEPILGSTLEVLRSENLIMEETNEESNEYIVDLLRGTYKLRASKGGFLPDSTLLDMNQYAGQDTIVKRLFLTPKELTLELLTFDAVTREPVNGPTISVSDVDDPNKENIYQLNNLTNSLVLPIDRDFQYAINVQKRGYEQEDLMVNGADYPNELRIVKKIYLKRGNLESYLVLPLFFDNDFPDPKTWRTTSTKTYLETYPPYYSRKNEFKELFAEPLIGQNKDVAETDVENFFDNEVLAGKQDLERFLEQLEEELEKGENITLVVSGFASPKYLKNYNINLSKRRINTLKKQLQDYGDGLFESYLRNGMLDIEGKGYGAETAPETVSDSQEDVRSSVYSPAASRERRIEIVDIIRK
ncbi:hypothetical protein KUV50_04510 [Membranicola marinus]|uniref:Outer membrane protein OmpA n=1 Tax=Membranihabitans marinus TaxID=1227546 RepID=A0A953L686_9BACT|nr:hypothetical protein [Membranihabitans marinus]MBY5957387.1 hypothetical protein [Membranihabitans marinus]